MTQFEFNFAFISIIAGLALAKLLAGASRTLGRPLREIDGAHLSFSISIIILLLTIWWAMFRWSHHDAWSFTDFFLISVYISMFYVLASILYPAHAKDVPPFERIRTAFYATFSIYLLMELLHAYLRDGFLSPWWYLPMNATVILLSVLGMMLRKKRYDLYFGLLNIAINTAWPFLARLKG